MSYVAISHSEAEAIMRADAALPLPAIAFAGILRGGVVEPVHVDYPHEPGTLYDCAACESHCHCTANPYDTMCVACAIAQESNWYPHDDRADEWE